MNDILVAKKLLSVAKNLLIKGSEDQKFLNDFHKHMFTEDKKRLSDPEIKPPGVIVSGNLLLRSGDSVGRATKNEHFYNKVQESKNPIDSYFVRKGVLEIPAKESLEKIRPAMDEFVNKYLGDTSILPSFLWDVAFFCAVADRKGNSNVVTRAKSYMTEKCRERLLAQKMDLKFSVENFSYFDIMDGYIENIRSVLDKAALMEIPEKFSKMVPMTRDEQKQAVKMRSKFKSSCCYCGNSIDVGDSIMWFSNKTQTPKINKTMHYKCEEPKAVLPAEKLTREWEDDSDDGHDARRDWKRMTE